LLLEIQKLKQKLYKELDVKEVDKKEILEISRELDKLIIKSYNLDIKPTK
jgi:hypothetical protein